MILKGKDLNGAILVQGTQNVLTVWRPLNVLQTQEQPVMIPDHANELTQTTNDKQRNKDSYEKCM
jgi:hypothetical protein